MRELESKHKVKKVVYSAPVLILLVFVVGVFVRGAWRAIERQRGSSEMVRELQTKANQLEDRQTELEGKIERLKTEEGIEEELKSKYNVSAEGEQFIVFVDFKENQDVSSTSPSVWYKKWWNGLKNLLH